MAPVFRIEAVTSMLLVLIASRRPARVPPPEANVTVCAVRPELAVKFPSDPQVPNEKAKDPVPVEAVSLE